MNIWTFSEKNPPTTIAKLTTIPSDGFIWLNCEPKELNEVVQIITELTGITIHERHINDCLNSHHPCFFDSMQDYDLLIFRDLNHPAESGRVDTHAVSFLLFDKILLTVNKNDNAVTRIQERIQEPGRRQPAQPEALLHLILNAIVDNFLALRTPLTEAFTRWQSRLLDESNHFTNWKSLLKFKTDIRQLCMLCEEQQDAIGKWRQNMEIDITPSLSVRLTDLSNHISRVLRHARMLENELETLMQLHYALTGKRTNEVMRVLTVISAICLPLFLITNIFGMNFVHMIGLRSEYGFYYTLGSMVFLAIILLIIFKRYKWI